MNEREEHGWRVDIGMDGRRLIVTPGGHIAGWSENENDAQQIVGELNHVAELREQLNAAQRLVWRTDEGKRATADQLLERLELQYQELERRVAALEAIIRMTR